MTRGSATTRMRNLSSISSPSLVYLITQMSCLCLSGIWPRAVEKKKPEDVVRATILASQHGIRVPSIHRIVWRNHDSCYIMDRIYGTTLDIVWPDLGWITSLRLAFQLRSAINRLRSVVLASPGSLITGECRSFFLEDTYRLPPRAQPSAVDDFLDFWANLVSARLEFKKTPTEHSIRTKPILPYTRSFVFTHHDLAPRNIILDNNNQLWLLDWDLAGYYPRFFEHDGMYNFIPTAAWTKFEMWRWKIFACIASGFYGKEGRWLDIIRSRFTLYRTACRFNMKANGYAAVAGRIDRD